MSCLILCFGVLDSLNTSWNFICEANKALFSDDTVVDEQGNWSVRKPALQSMNSEGEVHCQSLSQFFFLHAFIFSWYAVCTYLKCIISKKLQFLVLLRPVSVLILHEFALIELRVDP